MPSLTEIIAEETKYDPKTLDQARTSNNYIRKAAGLKPSSHLRYDSPEAETWKPPSQRDSGKASASVAPGPVSIPPAITPTPPPAAVAPVVPTMTPAQALYRFRELHGAERAAFYKANLPALQAAMAEATGTERVRASLELAAAAK